MNSVPTQATLRKTFAGFEEPKVGSEVFGERRQTVLW